jgi:hypothetical protein
MKMLPGVALLLVKLLVTYVGNGDQGAGQEMRAAAKSYSCKPDESRRE